MLDKYATRMLHILGASFLEWCTCWLLQCIHPLQQCERTCPTTHSWFTVVYWTCWASLVSRLINLCSFVYLNNYSPLVCSLLDRSWINSQTGVHIYKHYGRHSNLHHYFLLSIDKDIKMSIKQNQLNEWSN